MKRIIYIASILSILNTGIGWSKEFSAPEQTVLHLAQIKTLANTQMMTDLKIGLKNNTSITRIPPMPSCIHP